MSANGLRSVSGPACASTLDKLDGVRMSGVDYEDDYDGRLTGALVSLIMWVIIAGAATAFGYGIAWALTS